MMYVKLSLGRDFRNLVQMAEREATKRLYSAGGFVAKIAKNSIRRKKKIIEKEIIDKDGEKRIVRSFQSSPVGSPPFTRGHNLLKKSIRFGVDRKNETVYVGPSGRITGGYARVHEFGGKRKGKDFPKRPFMGPALEKALPKLPQEFQNIL